jgi:hypothetical protein
MDVPFPPAYILCDLPNYDWGQYAGHLGKRLPISGNGLNAHGKMCVEWQVRIRM